MFYSIFPMHRQRIKNWISWSLRVLVRLLLPRFFSLFLSVPLFFLWSKRILFSVIFIEKHLIFAAYFSWMIGVRGVPPIGRKQHVFIPCEGISTSQDQVVVSSRVWCIFKQWKFPHTYIHTKLPTVEIHPLGQSNDCVSYNKWNKSKMRRNVEEEWKIIKWIVCTADTQ